MEDTESARVTLMAPLKTSVRCSAVVNPQAPRGLLRVFVSFPRLPRAPLPDVPYLKSQGMVCLLQLNFRNALPVWASLYPFTCRL